MQGGGQFVRGPIRTVWSVVAPVVNLVHYERSSPVGFTAPRLLAQGFYSDRRWMYPTAPSKAAGYIPDFSYYRRAPWINPPAVQRRFIDKLVFADAIEGAGLGRFLPTTVAVSRKGVLERRSAEPGGPFVIKPTTGHAGHGVALFDEFEPAVAACPSDDVFLIQEKVVAHPYASEVYPGSLNTIRVQAIRDGEDEPIIVAAVHRFGAATTGMVDNINQGGLIARVDLATGRLSSAVSKVSGPRRVEHAVHPDTGAAIAGRQVPFLDEVTDLVRRLMVLFAGAEWIGWDIAITEQGPIAIEGNAGWPGIQMLQAHGPIGERPAVRRFLEQRKLL